MRIDHLINGKSVAGKDYFETVNPATQEVLAEVASGGAAEVDAAVAAAKEAFPKWANTPAVERAKLVRKLGDLIAQHVPEIAQTETNDCGQVIAQTGKQLIPRAADNFYYFAEMCTRVDGHTYPTPTHLNYTLFHPVGVCALISPWNVPFMTATWKVAPCLAFGNTAVLKMSELSPLTAARLGELALEAGIPAGVLNLVHGYGKGAGEPLDEKTIVGPMISQGHLAKVRSYIELGQKEGASMLCGGLDAPALPERVKRGNYVLPTVFADVDNRMRIAQEEIFGPVACIIPFSDEAEAIRLANDIQYGLSSYVWTENIGKAHRVAAAVEAGMCFVNSQNVRDLRQPFGGTKASGTGREGGTWSYEVFCEPKNVAVSLGSHHIPHWGV